MMYNFRVTYFLLSIFLVLTPVVHAETVYVIDELKIGLHKDSTIDSPIIKLIPSGTALSVIERDNDLVKVEEAGGTHGWINSKYVISEKTGKSHITELEKNNASLQAEIENLKANPTVIANDSTDTTKDLERQLNSERLKVGGLQAELADIKASIANLDDSGELLNNIEDLKQENRQLISQLESSGIEVDTDSEALNEESFSINNWKQMTTTFLIIFILGMVGGAFALDFSNRRRHGGFRV